MKQCIAYDSDELVYFTENLQKYYNNPNTSYIIIYLIEQIVNQVFAYFTGNEFRVYDRNKMEFHPCERINKITMTVIL